MEKYVDERFLSFFLSFDTVSPPREDYVQVFPRSQKHI